MNLTAIGENFDVLPFDNCDLRNSATQEIRTPDEGVITLGVAVEMNSPGDGCHQLSVPMGGRAMPIASDWCPQEPDATALDVDGQQEH